MSKKASAKIFLMILALVVSAAALTGCGTKDFDKVALMTEDGFRIIGNFYDAHSDKAIILLHMLNSNKESWHDFALQMKQDGYSVLAIDSRGNGESNIKDKQLVSWRSFGAQNYNDMVLDVNAAIKFLEQRKIKKEKIILGGASIGANTALNTAAKNPGIAGLILLSPGLDYKGISVLAALNTTTSPVFIMVSKGDAYAAQSSVTIAKALRARNVSIQLDVYQSGTAHGTNMIAQYKDASASIIKWIEELQI